MGALQDYYEPTRDFTRDGCIVGARRVTYKQLAKWYVCRECGGTPVHKMGWVDDVSRDWAECADCEARDFIPQWLYDQQMAEVPEIIEKLPPELRALFPEKEPLDITAEQAVQDLFG